MNREVEKVLETIEDNAQEVNVEVEPAMSQEEIQAQIDQLNAEIGKIQSKFRSTNGISMSPKFKIIDSRDCYPGPGAYRSFSEFGIYEKDDSKRTLKSNIGNKTTSNLNNKEGNTDEK